MSRAGVTSGLYLVSDLEVCKDAFSLVKHLQFMHTSPLGMCDMRLDSMVSLPEHLAFLSLHPIGLEMKSNPITCHCHKSFAITGENSFSPKAINKEVEGLLLNAINMSFFKHLNLAWKILFPPLATKRSSNVNIAKQRLKMSLYSDRCAVSDEAKQKIVSNIVSALSDFVEIHSQDKVQLSVSIHPGPGTMYSVTVSIWRVKPEYHDQDEFGGITNIEYKDTGERSGSVDVIFDFFIPNE